MTAQATPPTRRSGDVFRARRGLVLRRAIIHIPAPLLVQFKAACAAREVSMSRKLEGWIAEWLEAEAAPPPGGAE